MKKKLTFFLEITVALVVLVIGYTFVVGRVAIDAPAAADTAASPDNPHILYLALEGAERGKVNDAVMQSRGATPVRSWEAVRTAAENRPIDALLIDAPLFKTMLDSDKSWLQAQFRDGMVIVGLGVEDDQLAQALGLETLRASGEGDTSIGPTGYRMVSGLVLGQPDDVEKLEQADWLDQAIRDGVTDKPPVDDIKHLAITSFSKARGHLTSDEGLDELFIRLKLDIEGMYQTRMDYQKELENSEEK